MQTKTETKKKLKDFLRALSPKEKDHVWDWLDSDPKGLDALIDCVASKDGHPNDPVARKKAIKEFRDAD